MKNLTNKKILLTLVSVALLLTVAVSSTLAFLTDRTEEVTNTFTPTTADITITDEIEDGVKKNVVITNGNVRAFVRAKVVANWVKDGKIVAGWTDNILYNDPWYEGDDGFYYFPDPVEPNQPVTPTLFGTYTPGTAPVTGAHLVMDIIVQAVQADGIGTNDPVEAFDKLNAQ